MLDKLILVLVLASRRDAAILDLLFKYNMAVATTVIGTLLHKRFNIIASNISLCVSKGRWIHQSNASER